MNGKYQYYKDVISFPKKCIQNNYNPNHKVFVWVSVTYV